MFTKKRLICIFIFLIVCTSDVLSLDDNRISINLSRTIDASIQYSNPQISNNFTVFLKKSPTWASQKSTFYRYNADWSLATSLDVSSIVSEVIHFNSQFICFVEDKSKLALLTVTSDLDTFSIIIPDSISILLRTGSLTFVGNVANKHYYQKGTILFYLENQIIFLQSTDSKLVDYNEHTKLFTLVKQTVNQTIVEVRDTTFKLLKQDIIDKKEYLSINNYSQGVILTSTFGNYTHLLSISSNTIRSTTLEVNTDLLKFFHSTVFVLEKKVNGFQLNSLNLNDNFKKNELLVINDPFLFEAEYLFCTEKNIYIFFRNGIIVSDKNGEILSKEYFQFGNFFDLPVSLIENNQYTYLSNENSTFVFKHSPNNLWWFYKLFFSIGQYFLIILLGIIFVFGLRKYFQKNKILQTLLGLQTVGVVFVIDGLGRLTLLNELSRVLLKIPQFDGLGRLYYYYFENKALTPFREFIEKSFTVREPISQEIVIETDDVNREFLISSTPILSSTGRFSGVLITAVEITEQLESKRLENWAHLAHDMQTNLSIVKLNAENIESNSEADGERTRKIIFQTKLLMQRIRDLVTVGKSSTLELETVYLSVLLQDVFNEFDPIMYPSVTFIVKSNDFTMVCDPKKLSRAVRNAVENAIRSLQGNPGIVELSAWKETGTTYISINDTGVGMDEDTKKNMLKPYFTTSKKYGGTGIGSIIMQKVLALHNAEISVESEVGTGTKIIFKIPEIIPQRLRTK